MKDWAAAAIVAIALLAGPTPMQAMESGEAPAVAPAAQENVGPMTQLFISPCGKPFRAPAKAPYPVAAWFAEADANHDGAISPAEFRADADAFFNELDVNHDGVLSSPEIWRYEHIIAPEVLQIPPVGLLEVPQIILAQVSGTPSSDEFQPKEDTAPSMEGAVYYNLLRQSEPVTSSDQDLNGLITRAEFKAAADRRFGLLDPKGTGKLTLATLPQTMQEKSLGKPRLASRNAS
jgi:hypothetical protein